MRRRRGIILAAIFAVAVVAAGFAIERMGRERELRVVASAPWPGSGPDGPWALVVVADADGCLRSDADVGQREVSCGKGKRTIVLAVATGSGADGVLQLRTDSGQAVRLVGCERGECIPDREIDVTCKDTGAQEGGAVAMGAGGSSGPPGADSGERGGFTTEDSVETVRGFIAPEPPPAGFSIAETHGAPPPLETQRAARDFLLRELCA